MKKINYFNIIIALAVVAIASGCRKVVEWDLPDSETTIVVQSNITTKTEPWQVKLTLTQDYFAKTAPEVVSDAEVVISDDKGLSDTLFYAGEGIYKSVNPQACVPGNTYNLTVHAIGKTFTASDYCREQLPIDTLFYFFLPKGIFFQEGFYVFELSKEIQPKGDFYWWRVFKNDTLKDDAGYLTDTDEFANFSYFNQNFDPADLGSISPDTAPRPFPFVFEIGDTVRVEQYCINKGFYDFITQTQIQQNKAGSPFDAPPGNPISNISNGGWGYFGVMNAEVKTVVIE